MSFIWESLWLSGFLSGTRLVVRPPIDLHAKWLKWRAVTHRCAYCSKNRTNTPYSSSEPNKKVIVNRQCTWGRGIKICTQILHREYMSRDIAYAQWWFALVRHFGVEYLKNYWRYELGHNGAQIRNGVWTMEIWMITWLLTSRDLEARKVKVVTQLSSGPTLPIHYDTFIGLRWRIRGVCCSWEPQC